MTVQYAHTHTGEEEERGRKVFRVAAALTTSEPTSKFVCDYNFAARSKDMKLVMLGMTGTGKTSLLARFFRGTFSASPPETVGAVFASHKVRGDEISLQVQLQV